MFDSKEYYQKYYEENGEKIREASSNWKKANPEKHKENCRRSDLRRMYKLTIEQFDSMQEEQDNKCAICKEENPNQHRFHVDHNHNCCPDKKSCGNCVRGLLCKTCNNRLGYFEKFLLECEIKSATGWAKFALDYLSKYPPVNLP